MPRVIPTIGRAFCRRWTRRRITAEAAIELVARRAGLAFEFDGAELVVTGRDPSSQQDGSSVLATSAAEQMERRLIQLAHVTPAKLLDAVRVLAVGGEVWADESSRTMIVSASAAALRQIDALVALLDVPAVAVRGVLRQGEEHVAIIEIDGATHIVRSGESVAGVKVLAVDVDGVLIETIHGQRIHVGAGGK